MHEKHIHDAPWLSIADQAVMARFLDHFRIDRLQPRRALIGSVIHAFAGIPYENLTKIIKHDILVTPSSAMRYPDELLADFFAWGTGGTCFSLTAALVAVLDAMGIEAYPVLADRHYGPDTHCGVMIPCENNEMLLLDPGYLVFEPIPAPRETPVYIEAGFNRIELRPLAGGARVELWTIVKTNRTLRLTFKMEPVSDEAFGRAWQQSFAFEMMRYPVLTRVKGGSHIYLQGNNLVVRDSQGTLRQALTPEKEIEYITSTIGIHRDIVLKALERVDYGRSTASACR